MSKSELDIKTLENWLWEAACKIRGEIDAPKYKDYILPLIFLKRLCDVFEDEVIKLSESYGSRGIVEQFLNEDHSLVRFYIPIILLLHLQRHHIIFLGNSSEDALKGRAAGSPLPESIIFKFESKEVHNER